GAGGSASAGTTASACRARPPSRPLRGARSRANDRRRRRRARRRVAGAPGFEPGIAGPKPAALPLGYAPRSVRTTLAAVGEEDDERDDRQDRDCEDREAADQRDEHGYQRDENL